MTINEIYLSYMPTKELTLAPKTVQSYVSAYEKHIKPVFGHRHINAINFIDYQKFADTLHVSGLKPKTVSNILKFISSLYTFAKKNDWYTGTIYPREVELPKYDNKFYVTISPALQKKYLLALKNADEPIYRDIFFFLLHGRRMGEVLNLEWEYLDLNQGIVYYPATHNKSKKFLSYELTSEMVARLKVLHARAIEDQGTVFVTGYVFVNPNTGNKFTDLRKPWKRLLDANGLSYTRLHNIRHILATYLLNELNVSLEYVSYVLGHQDTAITKRYVNVKPQVAKDSIDILFDDLKSKGEKHVEMLSEAIKLGESIQAVLFSDKKFSKVGE